MKKDVVGARYFREQLALEIQENFNFIGDDFLKGMNSRQICDKYEIAESLNKKPGKAVRDSILMAVGGFYDMNEHWIDGLVPRDDYKRRTSESHWRGVSSSVKSSLGKNANDMRMLKNGMVPWSDDERYMIWLAVFAPDDDILDSRGRVRRNDLTELLNGEFGNNRVPFGVRNVISGFRKLRRDTEY